MRYKLERQLLLRRLKHIDRYDNPEYAGLVPLPDGYDDEVASPETFIENFRKLPNG
jgi:hypothetical protein